MTINYYNNNAEDFFYNTVEADMSETYKQFLSYFNNGDFILDLGCGSGRDSKYFLDKGYNVTSADLSDELIERASKFIKQKVLKLDMLKMKFENDFDGIWACASILHIPKNQVSKVLSNCFKALRKNGVLYASFKYGDFEEVRNGRFFNYYDEASIKKVVENSEFILEKIWITRDVRLGRENEKWLNIILKK